MNISIYINNYVGFNYQIFCSSYLVRFNLKVLRPLLFGSQLSVQDVHFVSQLLNTIHDISFCSNIDSSQVSILMRPFILKKG